MLLLSRAWAVPLAAGCGLVALVVAGTPASAQDNGLAQQFDDFRSAIGLGKDRPPIDFSERPPLAVPPSYTLPPPVTAGTSLPVRDPDVEARRKALSDARRPVPPTDPGARATGRDARTYLIDPPAGFRDPKAVTADIEVDNSPADAPKAARKHKGRKRKAAKPAQ